MGLNHLQTESPCADWGEKCHSCRLRHWCILIRGSPPLPPKNFKRRR